MTPCHLVIGAERFDTTNCSHIQR